MVILIQLASIGFYLGGIAVGLKKPKKIRKVSHQADNSVNTNRHTTIESLAKNESNNVSKL